MSNTSFNKVDSMHRYTNDVSMMIVLSIVLAAGFLCWNLFYRKKNNPDSVAQRCSAIATSAGKPTRVVDNQCQMEVATNQWYTIKMN